METKVKVFLFTALVGVVMFVLGSIFSIDLETSLFIFFIKVGLIGEILFALALSLFFLVVARKSLNVPNLGRYLLWNIFSTFMFLQAVFLILFAGLNLFFYSSEEHLYYWGSQNLVGNVFSDIGGYTTSGPFWGIFSTFFLIMLGIKIFRKKPEPAENEL